MTATPVFALGTGRCGTKSLAKIFEALPEVVSLHEPSPNLSRIAAMVMKGEEPQEATYIRNALIAHRMEKITAAKYYLESSLWNTWLIKPLASLWPTSKFVWMSRNLWEWAASAYRRGWYCPRTESHNGTFGLLRPIPERWWPEGVDRWYKLGWMWRVYEEAIPKLLSSTGCPWIRVDVGNLNSPAVLEALRAWCELPPGDLKPLKENDGAERITVEEIVKGGLVNALREAGMGIDHALRNTPHAWVSIEELQKAGIDVGVSNNVILSEDAQRNLARGAREATLPTWMLVNPK